MYENYLIHRNRWKFKLIITREIKHCGRLRKRNSMRMLGYYEVFSLLKTYKFLLYGFPQKRTLEICIILFYRNKFKYLPVLPPLLFIYFFPETALEVRSSTVYFPPNVFHSLPRPTAYTEIGEDCNGARKHPQMQHLHGAYVPGWGSPTETPFTGGSQSNGRQAAQEKQGSCNKKYRRGHPRDKTGWDCFCRHCMFSSYSYRMLSLVKLQTLIIWPM